MSHRGVSTHQRKAFDLSPLRTSLETRLLRVHQLWAGSAPGRATRMVTGYLRRPAARDPLYVGILALSMLLGSWTMHPGSQQAMVWPAAGVGVLWMLPHVQRRRWWSQVPTLRVAGLLLLTSVVINLLLGLPLARSVTFAMGTSVQAVVTSVVYAQRKRPDELTLTSPERLHRLLLAAVVGAVAGLPFGPGMGVLFAGASWDSLWQFVVRNTVSVFLVGLVGLLLSSRTRSRLPVPSYGARLVGIILTSLIVLWLVVQVPGSMLLFVLIPLGMVVAYWTEPRTTAWHTLAVSTACIVAAVLGVGPMEDADVTVGATIIQAVVLVLSVVSMSMVLDREEKHRLVAEVEGSRLATLSQAQLMERLIYSIHEGVLLVGADCDVIVSNPAARRLLGISGAQTPGELELLPAFLIGGDALDAPGEGGESDRPEEFAGEDELIRPEICCGRSSADHPSPVLQALAGQPSASQDVVINSGPGADPRVLSVAASAVETVEGTQAVVLVRDVTREREHTAELRRFARVVAHDLLNPVTAIKAWSEVVAEELADAGQLAFVPMVTRIHSSAGRMQQLIDDLVDYSLTRQGDLVTNRVDLTDLVEQILDAGVGAGECLDAVSVRTAASHPVQANPAALRQVMSNLIGNAVKYTAPGSNPTIEVRTAPTVDGMIRVSVADRGIGVPAGQEQEIFREFYRAADHAAAYPGTGLGLAICRRIVERHGGTITARRRLGGGSEIAFTLPSAGEDPAGTTRQETRDEPAPAVAESGLPHNSKEPCPKVA